MGRLLGGPAGLHGLLGAAPRSGGAGLGKLQAAWLLSQLSPGRPGYELAVFAGALLADIMPLLEAVLPKLLRSPQLAHISDGADNFLDLPTRNYSGAVLGWIESINSLRTEA